MSELYYAEMEAARNVAEQAYFEARPQLFGTIEQKTLFKAGFERGFKLLWDKWLAHQLGSTTPKGVGWCMSSRLGHRSRHALNAECIDWLESPAQSSLRKGDV